MDLQELRLKRFLGMICDGKRAIRSVQDASLLISAVCNEQDKVQCLAKLCANKNALQAMKKALCLDLSTEFLETKASRLFHYFATDELQQVHGGVLLRDLFTTMLTPPLIWQAWKSAISANTTTDHSFHAFACLVLKLMVILPPSSPLSIDMDVIETARTLLTDRRLLGSEQDEIRCTGYKLQETLRCSAMVEPHTVQTTLKPGGRHDNDFADFRKIAVFPTKDELLSKEDPFMSTADTVLSSSTDCRAATYLDNQFRLLREDMLAELREDLQRALAGNAKHRGVRLRTMQLSGISCGQTDKLREASIEMRCWDTRLKNIAGGEKERKSYFMNNKSFIKHGSIGCILADNNVISFAMLERDEEKLSEMPSALLLRVMGEEAVRTTLQALKLYKPHDIDFIIIDTPFFAYEPILNRLQEIPSVPLVETILGLQPDETSRSVNQLHSLAAQIQNCEGEDLAPIINVAKEIRLDHAQTQSLIAGLTQTVSMIQGPPGTGKSFIGAILTKCFYEFVPQTTILVLCFTNHALDQFLGDIIDIGVPQDDILRLGSKSTARTKPLTLYEQAYNRGRLPQAEWHLSQSYRSEAEDLAQDVSQQGNKFSRWKHTDEEILESLMYSDTAYFNALSIPINQDGMSVMGANGKPIESTYLLQRWFKGQDAGIFKKTINNAHKEIWSMVRADRQRLYTSWMTEATTERAEVLCDNITHYNEIFEKWNNCRNTKIVDIMKNKRIIGCTTTAAAKYAKQIALVKPGIVLVEEAGEVLESHVITAMSIDTQQLVMIGDHLQLRPKVKNYALTVEKGDGFDLNRSLFERLVLGGHPHTVLTKQHRMRPQISALVRQLTYPELEDASSVQSRPNLDGLQSNVIFIDHQHPETSETRLKDRGDEGSTVSRQNMHEVRLIMKIVKYLAQQGYGTDNQVVLTPYLGQLKLICDELKRDHDPVLSDLDSYDLVKAGLVTPASANLGKRSLRVSTIDNFQGEESDIVIASLTRSNQKGDIGFMSAAQRLNVLLSRARNGLIIVGNAKTFISSKKGANIWSPFFTQLRQSGHFFDGLPVKCQQHPDKAMLLITPADFEEHCPNGGCTMPCAALLKCGKHGCPEKCHQLVDHSKMQCGVMIELQCPKSHKIRWQCWKNQPPCATCERNAKLEATRQKQADRYYEQLFAVEDLIANQQADIKRMEDEVARCETLKRKKDDLVQITKIVAIKKATKQSDVVKASDPKLTAPRSPRDTSQIQPTQSPAVKAWLHQKAFENADNPHIDAIMKMVGLESVKQQVLTLKDKVDTALRQGANLTKERFGVMLLGNPGTGKTTIAKHYAGCLASMGIVSGCAIRESTASKLSNGGVILYKKLIDDLLEQGGGALFVDEAYQLTNGANPMGRQVLDAIMDDVETLTGKVVFILAGYRKEMETLLEHNPGLTSRLPYELSFEDYKDDELLQIFRYQLDERFTTGMKVEQGLEGLYARIVARRVGYGRGRPSFGNARAVANAIDKILSRQASRLSNTRRADQPCDDFEIMKDDMLGAEPSDTLQSSEAWTKLQSLIGLDAVKKSVHALMESVKSNYQRELREEPLVQFNLNRIFLGSPGTGKTTVAKLYAQLLADIGVLSKGEVVVKNPSDFVGDVLGASEKTTKGILNASIGKVLVIDEAYGLRTTSTQDPYKAAVVDTIVAEVQSVPGDDRCVLLLGYEAEMEEWLRNANPGLARRFQMSEAFVFEDFTDAELFQVLDLKLKQQAFTMTKDALQCTMDVLQRARNRRNFGNAGEVDIILNTAKQRHQERQISQGGTHNTVLEAIDVNPNHNNTLKGPLSVQELFEGTMGNENLVSRLEQIQRSATNMKQRGLDPRDTVPYNFVFTGPPGTGKTTTARKIGMLYLDIGILGSDEVLEKSASDLIGQYIGHTAHKTRQLLESALGKVLLVDEAYRLADGPFAKEALDELVDLLTKPQFARKLIVVLAGYNRDIQQLMSTNPGLTSRFSEKISFGNLTALQCIDLLLAKLRKESFLDVSNIQSLPSSKECVESFETLARIGDWANARDVETLAKNIAREQLCQSDHPSTGLMQVSIRNVLDALRDMAKDRQQRAALLPQIPKPSSAYQLLAESMPQDETHTSTRPDSKLETRPSEDQQDLSPSRDITSVQKGDQRDVDVSDDVWQRLTLDKRAADEAEAQYIKVTARLVAIEEDESSGAREVMNAEESLSDDNDNERVRRERRRIELEVARRSMEAEKARLKQEKEEMDAIRAHELRAQQKLRQMGLCEAGFRWIKQCGGYRCAGGGHMVSDAALDSMSS